MNKLLAALVAAVFSAGAFAQASAPAAPAAPAAAPAPAAAAPAAGEKKAHHHKKKKKKHDHRPKLQNPSEFGKGGSKGAGVLFWGCLSGWCKTALKSLDLECALTSKLRS